MYNFYLTVTQKWHTSVEADNRDEAIGLAKLAYDRESNPWESETLQPIGDEVVVVEEALSDIPTDPDEALAWLAARKEQSA